MTFRPLKADEIDVRVGSAKLDKGCTFLLYKDARCDMNILDETVGCENWKREHYYIDGKNYCTVSIYCCLMGYEYIESVDWQWVSKQDVGTESYTEKEKGEASDAFKRACVNWGIGRELYTAPLIWVNAKDAQLEEVRGKVVSKAYPKVAHIKTENGRIKELRIVDKSGQTIFEYGCQKYSDPDTFQKGIK